MVVSWLAWHREKFTPRHVWMGGPGGGDARFNKIPDIEWRYPGAVLEGGERVWG